MEKLSTSIKSIVGEDTCTKVYSTEDQKIIGIFPSYTKACAFLGVRKCDLSGIVKKKAKHFSKALQKEVVVRLGLIKELEPEYVIDNIVKIPATFASATYPLAAIDGE